MDSGEGQPPTQWATPGVSSGAAAHPQAVEPLAWMQEWESQVRAAAADPGSLTDDELSRLMLELSRCRDFLDAQTARVAVVWRARQVWEADGSRSAVSALARDTGAATATASACLRRARRVSDSMPHTQAAWQAGALSSDKVDLLVRANTCARAELFMDAEESLVADIAPMLFCDAEKTVKYWINAANTVLGLDGRPERRRHLRLSETFDGAVAIQGVLDPVGGAAVKQTLEQIAEQFAKKDRLAVEDGVQPRDPSERLADALVELAMRASTAPKDGHRPKFALKVAIGTDSLARLCETFSGIVIRPEDLLDYLADASVQFFRFAADGHPEAATHTKDAGFFIGRMRTAIQLRDRRCQHESGCDQPISRCDVDHIWERARGGCTVVHNGRLLCIAHNRLAHLRHPRRE